MGCCSSKPRERAQIKEDNVRQPFIVPEGGINGAPSDWQPVPLYGAQPYSPYIGQPVFVNVSYNPYQAANVYGAMPYNAQPMATNYAPQGYGQYAFQQPPLPIESGQQAMGQHGFYQYQKKKKVLIIGAGIAGMKVAHTLAKHNIDFCLIEYSDYMGGRIRHAQFQGATIEEGANWINGTKHPHTGMENPIWTMCKNANMRVQPVSTTSQCIDQLQNGRDVTDQFNTIYDELDNARKNLRNQLKGESFNVMQDQPIAATLAQKTGWASSNNNQQRIKEICEWIIYDGEYGEDIKQLSTFHNIMEEFTIDDFGEENVFVNDRRGFNQLFQSMANEILAINQYFSQQWQQNGYQIQQQDQKGVYLNHRVTQINYFHDQVQVDAINMTNGAPVVFRGDFVVCTTSVGVLKRGLLNFNPPLPNWKLEGLNQIEMANYVKIFAKFKKPWWDRKAHEYIYIASDRKGTYPQWKHIHPGYVNGQFMSFCVVTGNEARRIERTDKETIIGEIHYQLKTCYGDRFSDDVLRPVDIHVTKWDTDPRFLGSYSTLKAGRFQNIPLNSLIDPVTPPPIPAQFYGNYGAPAQPQSHPTLFFAGEAFDLRYAGLLQGAYNSGWNTAIEIVKTIKNCDQNYGGYNHSAFPQKMD